MDIASLTLLFSKYGILVLILGGIFGGEEVILSLVFLSAIGLFPLWWILVFVTLGEFISDFTIFSLGRLGIARKIKNIKKLAVLYKRTDKFVIKISKESVFLTILYSKFIYGTRVFTLLYLSSKKIRWTNFLISESLVLSVWMPVTIAIGWFAGASVKKFIVIFKDVEVILLLLLVFIVLIVIVKKWIQKELLKKQKQLN